MFGPQEYILLRVLANEDMPKGRWQESVNHVAQHMTELPGFVQPKEEKNKGNAYVPFK